MWSDNIRPIMIQSNNETQKYATEGCSHKEDRLAVIIILVI